MSLEKLNIIAIGGGKPLDGMPFLERGLELTGVERQPHVLVIPSSKLFQHTHDQAIANARDAFHATLGLPTEVLHDFESMPTKEEVAEKIDWADLVYISGGDTARMMEIWKTHGINTLLQARALGGLTISGISAGAVAPFAWGLSDPRNAKNKGQEWDYRRVDGLGLVPVAVSPHYELDDEKGGRRQNFLRVLQSEQAETDVRYGIGIENGAAIEISGGEAKAHTRSSAIVEFIDAQASSQPERVDSRGFNLLALLNQA